MLVLKCQWSGRPREKQKLPGILSYQSRYVVDRAQQVNKDECAALKAAEDASQSNTIFLQSSTTSVAQAISQFYDPSGRYPLPDKVELPPNLTLLCDIDFLATRSQHRTFLASKFPVSTSDVPATKPQHLRGQHRRSRYAYGVCLQVTILTSKCTEDFVVVVLELIENRWLYCHAFIQPREAKML